MLERMDSGINHDPLVFRYLRKELNGIPPDDLRRIDNYTMRALAIKALECCEYLASSPNKVRWDIGPESIDQLEILIERLP